MNKRKWLWILACGCILTACNSEGADVEESVATGEISTVVEETKEMEIDVAQAEGACEVPTEENKSGVSAQKEKKRIHRVTVKTYEMVDGVKSADVAIEVTEQTIDGDGYLILEENYGGESGESLIKRTQYIYDEKGDMCRTEETWYDNGTRKRIWEYEYDSNKQPIKEVMVATEAGQKDTIYLNSYDADGKLVEMQRVQEEEIRQMIRYTYDEAGNMVCQSSNIPSKGDAWEDTTYQYTYDAAGNILKMEQFEHGKLYYTRECTYDDNGNMLTKAESGIDVVGPGLWSYEYDDQGNCIKESELFAENDPFWTKHMEYSSEGELEKLTWIHNDGTTVVKEYLYELIEE